MEWDRHKSIFQQPDTLKEKKKEKEEKEKEEKEKEKESTEHNTCDANLFEIVADNN